MRIFLQELVTAWNTSNPGRSAAALAYYSMFSLAPMLYVVLTVASFFMDDLFMNEQFYGRMAGVLGTETAEFIEGMVTDASPDAAGSNVVASLVSLGALLYGATGLFASLKHALNAIWQVPPAETGGLLDYLQTRLLAFVLVLGVGLLLVLAAVLSILTSTFTAFFGFGYQTIAGNVLSLIILTTLAFLILYRVLPDVEVAWRAVWPGALVAALLVAVGRWIIAFYLSVSGVNSAFAAAGALAVLLIAVYYGVQMFLFGAIFTKVYTKKLEAQSKLAESPNE